MILNMLSRVSNNTFVGFLTIGVLTVLFNLATFQVLIWLGSSIYLATFFGNLVSIVVNYSGLSGVFKAQKKIISAVKYLSTWVTYYFLTIGIVVVFINLSFTPLEARVTTLVILTPINYLAQKLIVFKS